MVRRRKPAHLFCTKHMMPLDRLFRGYLWRKRDFTFGKHLVSKNATSQGRQNKALAPHGDVEK